MNYVDLSQIPKHTNKGAQFNKTDWSRSSDKIVKFEYNGIIGEIKILSFDKKTRMLNVLYNNKKDMLTSNQLQQCQLSKFTDSVVIPKYKLQS